MFHSVRSTCRTVLIVSAVTALGNVSWQELDWSKFEAPIPVMREGVRRHGHGVMRHPLAQDAASMPALPRPPAQEQGLPATSKLRPCPTVTTRMSVERKSTFQVLDSLLHFCLAFAFRFRTFRQRSLADTLHVLAISAAGIRALRREAPFIQT